jgi:Tfp pilus assembly protein PilF
MVQLDPNGSPIARHKPVLGYYSWGSTDPAVTSRSVDLGFVPGALAGMFVSTDGRTFKEPPAAWTVGSWRDAKKFFEGSPQSLIGDLIRAGVTGVAGHVTEPFLNGSVRPQTLFPAYVAGFNLAEAFYLSMPFLSWQNLVVGDPFCAPFRLSNLQGPEIDPPQDPETELPAFFSAKRLAVLAEYGIRPTVAKLLLKASARLMHADPAGARTALEAVTILEPELNVAHFVLAGIYDTLGEHDLAIERYRKILSTAPTEVRSLNNLAYTLAVNKQQPEPALPLADKAYRLAHDSQAELALDPGYSVLVRKGTPAGVLPFAPEGLTTDVVRAQVADTLGWVQHLLGDDARAEKYIKQAADGAATNAEVLFHLATVHSMRGRAAEGRAVLDRALAIDPAMNEREDVQKVRGRLEGR